MPDITTIQAMILDEAKFVHDINYGVVEGTLKDIEDRLFKLIDRIALVDGNGDI